jgi:nicotinamide mononucleotide transporter
LGAQWLQNRKKLEHWYFWITADVFYLFLYGSRGLWLTGLLYAIFLGMCLVGLREWRRAIAAT